MCPSPVLGHKGKRSQVRSSAVVLCARSPRLAVPTDYYDWADNYRFPGERETSIQADRLRVMLREFGEAETIARTLNQPARLVACLMRKTEAEVIQLRATVEPDHGKREVAFFAEILLAMHRGRIASAAKCHKTPSVGRAFEALFWSDIADFSGRLDCEFGQPDGTFWRLLNAFRLDYIERWKRYER